jgi:hypothetical protein
MVNIHCPEIHFYAISRANFIYQKVSMEYASMRQRGRAVMQMPAEHFQSGSTPDVGSDFSFQL